MLSFLSVPTLTRALPRHSRDFLLQRRPHFTNPRQSLLTIWNSKNKETLTPREAHQRQSTPSWKFLDVRTTEEYTQGHIPGSICVPFLKRGDNNTMVKNHSFAEDVKGAVGDGDVKVVVSCGTGKRSGMACEVLKESGFEIAEVAGGWGEWIKDESLPVEKGKGK